MTTTTKKTLYALALSTLMITITTISMEPNYPQLQLENPKQPDIMHVNCSIMISDSITTKYAMETVHIAIFEHSNLQSTIKDPVMFFKVQANSTNELFYLPLPVKYFVNFTDKSTVQIHETDGSKLFKNLQIGTEKQLLINAVCKKNPNLNGDSFAKQFKNAMNNFYANPGSPWADQRNTKELKNANIIKAITTVIPVLMHTPYGVLALTQKNIIAFEHGENGCPNETALVKSIIDEKIPKNKNIFTSLMHRQTNGSFPKK